MCIYTLKSQLKCKEPQTPWESSRKKCLSLCLSAQTGQFENLHKPPHHSSVISLVLNVLVRHVKNLLLFSIGNETTVVRFICS